jgi:hypothetical protein
VRVAQAHGVIMSLIPLSCEGEDLELTTQAWLFGELPPSAAVSFFRSWFAVRCRMDCTNTQGTEVFLVEDTGVGWRRRR